MNAKRAVRKFILPNIITPVILLIPPFTIFGLIIFLCNTLPALIRVKKCVGKLEENGTLENAATEMMSSNAKHLIKGKVIFTEHYMFCKGTGLVFTYDEIMWVYKHRFTRRFLLIPIQVTDSLYLATAVSKPKAVASMGKDKKEEIKDAILEIYNHNSKCLIGYTNENSAKYKTLSK